jgi:hypothetical protein
MKKFSWKNLSWLDIGLRPLGAAIIVFVGLVSLIVSFLVREGKDYEGKKASLSSQLLFSTSFLENWFYDIRTHHFYEHERLSPNLVILEISDASLS